MMNWSLLWQQKSIKKPMLYVKQLWPPTKILIVTTLGGGDDEVDEVYEIAEELETKYSHLI